MRMRVATCTCLLLAVLGLSLTGCKKGEKTDNGDNNMSETSDNGM